MSQKVAYVTGGMGGIGTAICQRLHKEGFKVIATGGTHTFLNEQGLDVGHVKKVLEGRPHIADAMKNSDVQLAFNTTEGKQSLLDSFTLRRTALMMKIPYYTTAAGAPGCANLVSPPFRALSISHMICKPTSEVGMRME